MKKSFFTRAFALVLTVLMLTGVCPLFTSAATNAEDDHIIVNAAEIASSIITKASITSRVRVYRPPRLKTVSGVRCPRSFRTHAPL